MPIDSTRPSSEYTSYVRERADIIKRGTLDFSSSLFRSAVFTSAFARPEPPTVDYGILTGFDGGPNMGYLFYEGLPSVDTTTDFTIECFFKTNNPTNSGCIFKLSIFLGNNYYGYYVSCLDSNLRVDGLSLFENNTVPGLIEANTWYFVAMTRSGNSWYLTLNNNTICFQEPFYINNVYYSIWIGTQDNQYGNINDPLNGSISNFRVSNTALYTNTVGSPPPSRPLQDISNTELLLLAKPDGKFADSSGNNNIASGTMPLWSPGPSDEYGILDFYYNISNLYYPNFGITGDFTIELFFKTSDTSNDESLWNIKSRDDFILMQIDDGGLEIFWRSRNVGYYNYMIREVEENTWYHVAVSRSEGTWYTSVNGFTTSQSVPSIDISSAYLVIGDYTYASDEPFYDGSISNFRVSNYARYTRNFRVPTPPLSSQGARLLLLAKPGDPFGDSAGTNVSVNSCSWAPGPIQLGSS
jgi:hypothetical protein